MPDQAFRDGILKLADKAIGLMNSSAEAYARRGSLYDSLGQDDKARADFEKALEFDPDNPVILNNMAWKIVRFPGSSDELVKKAVDWVKKVVELNPKKGYAWNTLGVARYRAGDWTGAIEALQKSEALSTGKFLGYNAFFLAMAHW